MNKKDVPVPKYSLGDKLLLKGSELDIERVLTVDTVMLEAREKYGDSLWKITYGFKESRWMQEEKEVIKKIEL